MSAGTDYAITELQHAVRELAAPVHGNLDAPKTAQNEDTT